jgi:hypothetical protein
MSKKPLEIDDKDEEFLSLLENGVREVLKAKRCTPAERLQAVNVGSRLLAIRHKIGGGDEENFFSK